MQINVKKSMRQINFSCILEFFEGWCHKHSELMCHFPLKKW